MAADRVRTPARVPRHRPSRRQALARWTGLALFAVIAACTRGPDGESAAKSGGGETAGGLPQSAAAGVIPGGSARARGAARQPEQPAAAEATVVRVRDGDSIVVVGGAGATEVRLDGIDCPELAQAFGRKAKNFTSTLVLGRKVRLDVRGTDRYGRVLAEVILPDGRSLNRELVAAGFAWWYRRYSTDRALEAGEQAARAGHRGLWAAPNPVPPWDFRAVNPRQPGRGR